MISGDLFGPSDIEESVRNEQAGAITPDLLTFFQRIVFLLTTNRRPCGFGHYFNSTRSPLLGLGTCAATLPSFLTTSGRTARSREQAKYIRSTNIRAHFLLYRVSKVNLAGFTDFPTVLSLTTMLARAFAVFSLVAAAVATPTGTEMAKRATCTVSSVASAADLSSCTAVVITAFTVASGSKSGHFTALTLLDDLQQIVC